MKKVDLRLIAAGALLILSIFLIFDLNKKQKIAAPGKVNFWTVQSVDTVKYSRDTARQFLTDPTFDKTIDLQVKSVAQSGANYIAIGTPYDSEFVPFLSRWVKAARKYGLNVWFRGNFSGWEGWFNYSAISREDHKALLKKFILDNGNLFEDGDIFTSCTECENGGPGDPRQTGDTDGFRQFLIDEYQIGRSAFTQIGKNVSANYFPMNGDVASLIMNKPTTEALGGIVVIDHYVPTPENLNDKVNQIADSSGGRVMIGEFGAPIPDIHGQMTESEQADWINRTLNLLAQNQNLVGLNYWTSFGGSTSLFDDKGNARQAVGIIARYFKPDSVAGVVIDETGQPINGAIVKSTEKSVNTDSSGRFFIPLISSENKVDVVVFGFDPATVQIKSSQKSLVVTLTKQNESLMFKVKKFLYQKLGI